MKFGVSWYRDWSGAVRGIFSLLNTMHIVVQVAWVLCDGDCDKNGKWLSVLYPSAFAKGLHFLYLSLCDCQHFFCSSG